jgi:flavin reductase (DIM6/NTAB) family NADH-FMN oxidoreductase RutF/rubredoxin
MQKKEAFFTMTYGMYLISCADGETRNAYIANTAFQVSAEPPMFAISCHKENYSTALIANGKAFSISVLEQDVPLAFIQRFGYQSAYKGEKFYQLNFKRGVTGIPVVYDYTVAWFECRVVQQVDVGTHWLFVGEVVDYGLLSSRDKPLDYGWYREHHKASSPSKAPTYVPDGDDKPLISGEGLMEMYACGVCDYVYNPARGDIAGGIPPGTSFNELPDDWKCPICGVGKMMFTETSGHHA